MDHSAIASSKCRSVTTGEQLTRRSGMVGGTDGTMGPVWSRGQVVVHQEVWAGRLWAARPLVVVEDTEERVLLWIPQGTRRKVPITPPHRVDPADVHTRTIESLQHRDWLLGDHIWDVSSLWILTPDRWHSTWVSWRSDGSHLGWYVNLQRPMRRNPVGFEAMDLMLDVVAEPNLSWRWKDREEFEEITRRGIFDRQLADRVMSEALSVIDDLERRHPPFDGDWPSWRPDPSWGLPILTDGWDHVHT
jgi:protein associated with RNAse G/E